MWKAAGQQLVRVRVSGKYLHRVFHGALTRDFAWTVFGRLLCRVTALVSGSLGFDSPEVVCYVPFKIGHASWCPFWWTQPVGGCLVRREIPDSTIEPSAGLLMMMGGFSVM